MSEEKEKTGPETAAGKKGTRRGQTLPVLLDFTLSAAQLVVILVGLATTVVSIRSGAPIWMVALRGGAAMFAVGLVFWLVNWAISKGSLELIRRELMEEQEKRKRVKDGMESTVEIQA
jgi:hypothetical protein